jgi:hypothetical protein
MKQENGGSYMNEKKMRKIELTLSKDALSQVGELIEFFSDKHDVSLTRDEVIELCIETTYRAFKRKGE